jgi:predicted nucleic acid-binding protein
MIIIDASVVCDSFRKSKLFKQILNVQGTVKAPEILIQEVLAQRSQISKGDTEDPQNVKLSKSFFDAKWKALLSRIQIEAVTTTEIKVAEQIIKDLDLDLGDKDYIALCVKYLKQKPTLWTYDSPFVYGDKANKLKIIGIYANFNI